MTIVAGLFAGSFGRKLGPRKGAVAAVVGISIYTILVGANAAVVRSAIGLDEFEALEYGKQIGQVSALLLTDNGYAPSNPAEWVENLSPEIVLLRLSSLDRGECLPRRRWRQWRGTACRVPIKMAG